MHIPTLGSSVRIKQPILTGQVTDMRLNKKDRLIEVHIIYNDAKGVSQARWLPVTSLEVLSENTDERSI